MYRVAWEQNLTIQQIHDMTLDEYQGWVAFLQFKDGKNKN
jgi:hypothetical protein